MRLIFSPPHDGITNMAIDQALMESVGDLRQPPTLRFYRWQPACLSLGYTQRVREVDFDRLDTHGWDVVRRPTGGKAILHVDELTYSISLPQNHPLVSGDILTSYRRLSRALLTGLEKLGLAAETAPVVKQEVSSPVCFETPSAYEITVEGRKLIGSAQVRRQKAVLQHGTLPLYGDIARICDALCFPDEQAREKARQQVHARATTVEAVLHRVVSWQEAAEIMAEAFAETFELDLEIGEFTPEESLRIEQLRHDVYGADGWLFKR
jgi:lipoate-protein ligase A